MARSRNTRTRWGMLAPVAMVVALAVAGCASLGGGGGATPGSGTGSGGSGGAGVDGVRGPEGTDGSGSGGTDGLPGDAAPPVLQVVHAGGFVPRGWDFRTVPDLTVYADGTVISHGPQILIYPGPALPALVVTRLDPSDVDAVVDAARDAGLLAEAPDYGQPQVTDMPTTVVTLRVDGAEHRHSAYALGGPGAEMELDEAPAAARAALTGFLEDVRTRVDAVEGEPLTPDRFAILADPVPDDAMQVEDGIEREVLPWPVDGVALADATECVTVDGEAGAALGAALAEANQLSVFDDDGVRYEVHARPLLPHETGCADLDV